MARPVLGWRGAALLSGVLLALGLLAHEGLIDKHRSHRKAAGGARKLNLPRRILALWRPDPP